MGTGFAVKIMLQHETEPRSDDIERIRLESRWQD